ncbi:E3 ubiquitin-protein ligase TRIM11-like isoform X2 [Lathamus discolor]|uniref:E3 ubiquitin-protein ligase TRIM11-like isoform X2 n=1 Tax=Lathamus discolor TaxID=678569 RepID=UPI0032B73D3B
MLEAGVEREESEPLPGEVEEMSGSDTVTLDPDSANPILLLAADRRGVRRGDEWSSVPDTAERFDTEPRVAFADAQNEAPIFAFRLDPCPGERLRPWLWVGMDSWLQLWP